ncbi:hypothetical protein ACG83_20795 [Frankia sp. R43]|uniref:MFS transporter n=1 Tax=Frankia sp. R43 TaxID=269536 RepID=UPI0006C9EE4E|nr:MFS transporter [Frankia sp. R43]KPM54371.1 hypothetical protein ACG83_20795 [Frankia sp. R43]
MHRFALWRLLAGPGRFGMFFLGSILTNIGTWAQNFAAVLLVYRLTGSTTQVGLVSVAQFAAPILLVRWTGAVADRVDRRLTIIVCQLLGAAATLVLVVASATGTVTPALVLAVTLVLGVFLAFQTPAQLALVPLLVTPAQLDSAFSLNGAQFNLARAVAPVLAGLLVGSFGFTVVFALNTVTFLLYLLAILLVRPAPQERPASRPRLLATLETVRRTRYVTTLLAVAFVVSGATDAAVTLGPALGVTLAGDDGAAGSIMTAFAGGAALAAIGLASWVERFRRRLPAAILVQALGLAGVALAPSLPVALVAVAVMGSAFILGVNRALSLIQQRVPAVALGRVMALFAVCVATSKPVFALADGFLSDRLGPRWAVAALAATAVVTGTLLWRQGTAADQASASAAGAPVTAPAPADRAAAVGQGIAPAD